jgi:hypothetical protein
MRTQAETIRDASVAIGIAATGLYASYQVGKNGIYYGIAFVPPILLATLLLEGAEVVRTMNNKDLYTFYVLGN